MKKVRTLNPLVISMVKRDIPLMCTGERIPINMKNLKAWVTVTSAISKDIRHMIAGLELSRHQDLKVTTIIARSMVIELLSADQSLCGHQTNQQRLKSMDITTIGITTLGKDVTIVRIIGTFLRTTSKHISVATIIDGCVKRHALVF